MPDTDSIERTLVSRLTVTPSGNAVACDLSALLVMRPSANEAMLRQVLARIGVTSIDSAKTVEVGLERLRSRRFDIVACEQDLGEGGLAHHLCDEARREGALPLPTMVVVVSRDRSAQAVMSVAEFEPDCCLLRPLSIEDSCDRLIRAWMHKRALDPLFKAMESDDPTLVDLQAQLVGSSSPDLNQVVSRLASEWLLRAGDLGAAEAYARRSLNVGRPAWALCRLAQIRVQQNRLADASELLDRAIEANPRHLGSLDLLSEIREREGRTAEALATFDCLTSQLDPSTSRMRRTGKLALRSGDLERAETALRWVDHHSREGSSESVEDRADLVEVLLAQGRDYAASALHTLQSQRLKDHPDAPLLAAMFDLDRLPGDATAAIRQAVGARLVSVVEGSSDMISISIAMRALQSCFRAGLRHEGFSLAAAVARCRRADQRQLDTLRQILSRLASLPREPRQLVPGAGVEPAQPIKAGGF